MTKLTSDLIAIINDGIAAQRAASDIYADVAAVANTVVSERTVRRWIARLRENPHFITGQVDSFK